MFVSAGAERGWEGRAWLLGWGLGEGSLPSPGAAWPGMGVGHGSPGPPCPASGKAVMGRMGPSHERQLLCLFLGAQRWGGGHPQAEGGNDGGGCEDPPPAPGPQNRVCTSGTVNPAPGAELPRAPGPALGCHLISSESSQPPLEASDIKPFTEEEPQAPWSLRDPQQESGDLRAAWLQAHLLLCYMWRRPMSPWLRVSQGEEHPGP